MPAPPTLVFTNAHVIDPASAEPLEGATVIVRGGRIERVVRGAAAPPAGAQVVDLRGMYLLPGLIDSHVHISNFAAAERALLSGVTTARSAGGAYFQDVGLRELAKSGAIRSPELLASGWHIPAVAGRGAVH